ncbi:MAG: hypothetical protein ACRDUX_24995 [Mycobacterium sp.]
MAAVNPITGFVGLGGPAIYGAVRRGSTVYRPPGSWQTNNPQFNGGRGQILQRNLRRRQGPSRTLSAALPPGSPYTHQ